MMLFIVTLVYIALYFLRPFEFVPGLVGLPMMQIVGGIGILFLGAEVARGRVRLFKNGTDQMMVGFFAAILLSHIVHAYLGGTIDSFIKFLPTFMGYFLVAHASKSEKQINILYWTIALCLLVPVFEGISQAEGSSIFSIQPYTRQTVGVSEDLVNELRIKWTGVFSDPNDLAMAFILPVPFLIGKILEKKFLIAAPVAVLLVYGVYLTQSRGGLLSLIACIVVFFVIKAKSIKGLIVCCVLGAMIAAFAPARMGDISAGEESAYGRLEAWYEGYQMFKNSPLFGVGMNMFTDYHSLTAHNSFVLVFSELGILGAFFFVGMFYLPLIKGYKEIFSKEKHDDIKKSWVMVMRIFLQSFRRAKGAHIAPKFERRKRSPMRKSSNPTNLYGVIKYFAGSDGFNDLSRASLSAIAGLMCSMFFLSRSYMLLPYLALALTNSSWTVIKVHQSRGKISKLSKTDILNIGLVTIGGIIAVNLLIKIFL
jgi:putative inorganic carbon (hco3(-)) transporter